MPQSDEELRDKFAAEAISGLIASCPQAAIAWNQGWNSTNYNGDKDMIADRLARQAYIIADAMLRQRDN